MKKLMLALFAIAMVCLTSCNKSYDQYAYEIKYQICTANDTLNVTAIDTVPVVSGNVPYYKTDGQKLVVCLIDGNEINITICDCPFGTSVNVCSFKTEFVSSIGEYNSESVNSPTNVFIHDNKSIVNVKKTPGTL